jgi:DNA-binding transcriptional LysR family regulator
MAWRDAYVRDALERGELVRVLERFCEPFPEYYLYHPQRRHASPAFRALIDHVQRARKRAATRVRRK